MRKLAEKIIDLEFNELLTLLVIEQNSDLTEIFNDENNLSFNVLYTLHKENKLSETTKQTLLNIFEKLILTRKEFVDKYSLLLSKNNVSPILTEPTIEVESETPSPKTNVVKKERALPRRYGKEMIMKDIQKQGGVSSPTQRAMLKINDLKNLYVNLSAKCIKDMFNDGNVLSDDDCRLIVSSITTIERQLAEIVKTKTKKVTLKK